MRAGDSGAMNEQEIKELIILAHMHKGIGEKEGWLPGDQTLRFAELARKAALALSEAQRRIVELEAAQDRRRSQPQEPAQEHHPLCECDDCMAADMDMPGAIRA